MPRRKKPASDLVEDRPLYKNVKAMIALGTMVASAGGGLYSYFSAKPPEVMHDATEIILDRSARMRESWKNTTRSELAAKAADEVLDTIAAGENLALREFGGECSTGLEIPFAAKNAKKVRDRVHGLAAKGKADLYPAINEAIGDFGRKASFDGSNRRILVITGSVDECGKGYLMDAISGKLQEHAKTYNIRLDIHFLGVGMDDAEKQSLQALAKVTGGTPAFLDDPADLDRQIREMLKSPGTPPAAPPASPPAPTVEEAKAPVRQDSGVLVDALKAGVKDLDEAVNSLPSGDFAAAGQALAEARRAGERSDAALANLKRQNRPEFEELYQAAAKCRSIHRDMLAKAQVMVKQYQANDKAAYKVSSADYDRMVSEFERTAKRINALLAKL